MGKKRKSKYVYIYNEPKIEYIYNTVFDLFIKKSNIPNSGLGVFTNEFINKNIYLGNYIGKKRSKYYPSNPYCIEDYNGDTIDAIDYPRTIFAMINDSKFSNYKNNCEFIVKKENVEIWTTKIIKKGSELFIDYGEDYWKYLNN